MTRYACALLCLLGSLPSYAEVGIGAAVESDDSTVFVPIVPLPRFMIEPYVRYADVDVETSTTATVFPAGRTDGESWSLGIGLFRLLEPAENFAVYYGGRLARVREETVSTALIISQFPIGIDPPVQRSELDGHVISPTVGIEYRISKRFSVGAEIGWERAELEGTTSTQNVAGTPVTLDRSIETTDTRGSVIVRFFF